MNVTISTIILLWPFLKKARTVTHTSRDQPRELGIMNVEVTVKRQRSGAVSYGILIMCQFLDFLGVDLFNSVSLVQNNFCLMHNNGVYGNHFVKEAY